MVPLGHTVGGLNTVILAAVPPALTQKQTIQSSQYHSGTPWTSVCLPNARVSVYEWEFAYWPLKVTWVCGRPAFQPTDTDFHTQMLWGLLSPALVLQAREPSLGLRLLAPQEKCLQLGSHSSTWVWGQSVCVILSVSMGLLLCSLNYRTSV